ncbi:MAG: DegT/DnrJ/EryC1/StrS family aminotransferase [Candidatus Omnitrophica bacterium]|nr:DegT/DnrJ/EryC1/StrS family aminotransferase [Candidatus Omnitrophota bacterium]
MIPHSLPTINSKMIAAVAQSMRAGQVSMGPQVSAFEADFTRKFKIEAAAVSSGTSALHLALLALGVGKGDEVILPTYVCTALLNAVNYTGAKPVLADVELEGGNISATDVRKKITRRTKAILVPHMFGHPADMKPLLKLGVPVVEDCAQAIGATYDGRAAGTMGCINIFSFYATKMMTSGEGGMVVSSDRKLMSRVRDMLAYDHKDVYRIRFNYKMTDMQAALGRVQLQHLNGFIVRRRKIAALYDQRLGGVGVVLPAKPGVAASAHYRYVVRLNGGVDHAIKAMAKRGVVCAKPLFKPLHQYLNKKGFPVADQLMQESLSLPIYPLLSDAQARRVADTFKKVMERV